MGAGTYAGLWGDISSVITSSFAAIGVELVGGGSALV